MLPISHGYLILHQLFCACKRGFSYTLTLIFAPQKANSSISMLFFMPNARLEIYYSTKQQQPFIFISVNFRLHHCIKGWVISPAYYVGLLWAKENQQN